MTRLFLSLKFSRMSRWAWSTLGLCFFSHSYVFADRVPPPVALSLDKALAQAIRSSESYRIVASQAAFSEVPSLKAASELEWRPFAKLSTWEDRREQGNPYDISRLSLRKYSAGVSTLFSSGTSLNFELSQGYTDLAVGSAVKNNYYEMLGTLSVTQKLWKNSLGAATRATQESAKLQSKALSFQSKELEEDWFLKTVELYYQTWLAQARVKASQASFMRSQALLKAVESRAARGTLGKPDLLQAQSAHEIAQVHLDSEKQALQESWRNLAASLRLSEDWLANDPSAVALELDQPMEEASLACGTGEHLKGSPDRSIALEKAEAQTRAAESSYRRAKSNFAPDLELGLSLGANGIAPQRSDALKEFGQVTHPLVSVQVGLSFPIGLHAEKAELQAASADLIRAEASLVQAQDDQKLGWMNACEQFLLKHRAYDRLAQAFRNQSERASLEEKRFVGGRTGLFSMIQSGGDALEAELSLRAGEVYRRIAAWKVLRRQGKISEKLGVLRSAAVAALPLQ